MEDLLDYLRRHFLAEPELLARSGVSLDTLRAWQRAGAAPWPSYRLTQRGGGVLHGRGGAERGVGLVSAGHVVLAGPGAGLGRRAGALARLFRPAVARWAGGAGAAARRGGAGLGGGVAGFPGRRLRVCTRAGLPGRLRRRRRWCPDRRADRAAKPTCSDPARRERLAWAVTVLDGVAAPFAPHERAASSRARCVELTRRFYLTEAA